MGIEKIKNVFKPAIAILFVACLCLYGRRDRVYAYSQNISTVVSGSSVDCGLQLLGTGLSGNIDTLSIKVINDTSGGISVNAPLRIVEYNDINYTCTYPCYSNIISASSFTYDPPARYSGGSITAGSQNPVTITANFSGKSFNPTKFYTAGYMASNFGNRLKIAGVDFDNWVYGMFRFDRTASYCRVDNPQAYSTAGSVIGLYDMYFSTDGDMGTPYLLTPTSESVDTLNHQVRVDLAGDFLIAGSNYLGIVKASSICTSSAGLPTIQHNFADATIRIYAKDCATSTRDLGSGYYFGQDYCYSPQHTGWQARSVALPYPDGYQCVVDYSYCLYNDETSYNAVVCGDLGTFQLGNPTATIPAPTCDTLDVGCWIRWLGWKIGDTFYNLFSFNGIDNSQFSSISSSLDGKIPFAYARAVYLSNWSAPITAGTAIPSLTFNFIGSTSVQWIPDSLATGFFGSIRPIIVVALWVGLVVYVVVRVRGLVQNL